MSQSLSRIALLIGSATPILLGLAEPQASKKKPTTPPKTGAQLFASNCAPCHGAKGVGGAGFSGPLQGDLTSGELAKYIASSMPPGPKKTPADQAKLIAEYAHAEFYSPLAQERNRPARVSLARMTVRQYRNAITDLVNGFHPIVPGEPGGLRATYYKNRDRNDKNKIIERVDSTLNFDFGTVGPEKDKVDPHNYSITWTGSIFAPETGEYELIVQSDQSSRVYFNGEPRPVVDGWVRSGNEKEFSGVVDLIGGRTYPVYIEFSKSTHGVNDDEKKKNVPPSPAHFRLMWRRPKMTQEVIPSPYLFPNWSIEKFVPKTAFPADDRSIGYERGNTVNRAWDDATTRAALEVADYVSTRINKFAGTKDDAPDRAEKAKAFCKDFLARAFRKPIGKEVEDAFVNRHFAPGLPLEQSVKRVLVLGLKSPRFLYRELGDRKDAYAVASELSFGLWDTLPDQELRRAAQAGELDTPQGLERQVGRMVNDPRSFVKLRDFLMLWLKVDEIPDIVKSQKKYPGFDDATVADLRTSLDLFLANTAWNGEADYRQLLLSNKMWLNNRLSKFYGGNVNSSNFQPVELKDRAGILTHPYMLARLAYLEGSSPIHRGVLIARNMLGRTLAPPPAAFAPLAESLHPNLTTRERVAMQTKPEMCNSCHALINPLGFPFEKYDAIGKLRLSDNGKPVDTSGAYKARNGTAVKFGDATDLARFIANSDEAHTAFTEKLFQHLTKQPVRAYGPKALPDLTGKFKEGNYNIKKLMAAIMLQAISTPKT